MTPEEFTNTMLNMIKLLSLPVVDPLQILDLADQCQAYLKDDTSYVQVDVFREMGNTWRQLSLMCLLHKLPDLIMAALDDSHRGDVGNGGRQ